MRVFAVSDLHAEYDENFAWVNDLSDFDFTEDVLLLPGDVTDNIRVLEQCFVKLAHAFRQVFFVPGNHDVWVLRSEEADSFEKYETIENIARDTGISMEPADFDGVSIAPLLGWYDYSFGEPCRRLKRSWMDYYACRWGCDDSEVTRYFLNLNRRKYAGVSFANETVISFSHFLPRIDIMPPYIPQQLRFIYPVLGSESIDPLLRSLGATRHVYGHSHLNQDRLIGGVNYINNAFGTPAEAHIARKSLYLVYET